MKRLVCLIGVCAALAGGSVIAQERVSAEQTAEAPAQDGLTEELALSEEDARMQEIVCREEAVTGSRTRVTRTCLTRAQWDAASRRTTHEVNDLQSRASGANSCTLNGPSAVCY